MTFSDGRKGKGVTNTRDGSAQPRKPKGCLNSVLLWLILLVMLPLALLALFELALRAAGYGHSTRFFVTKSFNGQRFYATHKEFFQPFFALPIDDMWSEAETLIPQEKGAGVYRVVVLGESAALGVPPDFAFSFGRVLDVMLRTRFPDTTFEVYTLAQPGVNSHVMRAAALACKKIQPDAVVVYMGNNEINGPFGPITALPGQLTWSLPFIRAKILVTDIRIAQLLTGHGRVPWHAPTPHVVESVGPDDPRLDQAYEYYRANLEDICQAGVDTGAKVFVCTVGCNLREWRPTVSMNRAGLTGDEKAAWDGLYQQGVALESQGDARGALIAYEAAAALDETHAELLYRMGRCYLALGDCERARAFFIRAWDKDLFRARVMRRVNEAAVDVAQDREREGIFLLDTAGKLAQDSPCQSPGLEFFYDNVHLTFEGNHRIASTIFENLVALLPDSVRGDNHAITPLTQAECEERMGLSKGVLLKHLAAAVQAYQMWWKSPTDDLDRRIHELEQEIGPNPADSIADGYLRAISYFGHDRLLRSRCVESLIAAGRAAEAAEQGAMLVHDFPYYAASHRCYGVALDAANRPDDAITEYDLALALFPREAITTLQRGVLLQKAGRMDDALEAFRTAIRANPRLHEAYTRIDEYYLSIHDNAARIREWGAFSKEFPDSARAHFLLGLALELDGDLKGAIPEYRIAAELNPFDPAIQACLGSALFETGNYREALTPLQAALQINPAIDHIYWKLIQSLLEIGDTGQAKQYATKCREIGGKMPPALEERLAELPDN